MNAPIEDQLRDYFTMVDRMQGPIDASTLSQDTSTLSLVTEEVHDPNESTMELIMIGPDRKEPSNRSRTWMLVAASVAAIALVGGLIVVANGDSEEAPANQPTVTVADTAGVDGETAPAPDTEQSDAQDPAPEAAEPEPTPDPVVEQATEAAPTTAVASSAATAGVLDGIWWKPRDPGDPLDLPITYQIGPGDLFVLDEAAQLLDPDFRGRYTLGDDVVTYLDNESVDSPCDTGGQARLAITIVDDGEIGSEVLEAGECSLEVGTPGSMIRLSPASAAGAAITTPDGEFDDTVTFPTLLSGVWLREGTGEVVVLHTDGTYARSDKGDVLADPDDRGTFVLVTPDAADDNESVSVVMTSDGTGQCAAGSTLTWDAVEWNKARSQGFAPIGAVHTIADDACGMSSGNQTWIHVSGA